MKLLYLDQDLDISTMYSVQLRLSDYEIVAAQTAQTALDLLDEIEFDMIILEILLPESNGIAVLHELRSYEDWRHIPVIILSHISSTEAGIDSQRMLDLGIKKYLNKIDTTPADLLKTVEVLI